MSETVIDARGAARAVVRDSIDPTLWEQNELFTHRLLDSITGHRLYTHPIIAAWQHREFSLETLRHVHLEVRAGFLEVFMESLLRLMQTTSQLERRLGPKAKVGARFLIQLNVLDELGFVPGGSDEEGFLGQPASAHYWQLMNTLTALGAPPESWWDHPASPEADATRAMIEAQHDDHLRLAAILATIETVFMPFYGPWASNTIHVCAAVENASNYHSIHVEDDGGHFVDDDHSEDSWFIVRQALTTSRYDEVEKLVIDALDTWCALIDTFVDRHRNYRQAA